MKRTDLVARIARFEALYLEWAKERGVMHDAMHANGCPMLRAEWLAYKDGLTDAIRGFENARVVLAQATERMERETVEGRGRIET